MISILDPDNLPPGRLEIAEALQNARENLRIWRKRTASSALVLFLGCASVYPFLSGHALHAYAATFGKYLIFASMGLLVVFTYCGAMLLGAWTLLREVKRDARGLPKISGVDQL